jgi:hypothetical protein
MKPRFMAIKLKDILFIIVVLAISTAAIIVALGMIAKSGL